MLRLRSLELTPADKVRQFCEILLLQLSMDLLSFYLGTKYTKLKDSQKVSFLLTWLVLPTLLISGLVSFLLKDVFLGIVLAIILTFILGRARG